MNKPIELNSLEEVLDAYITASPEPSRAMLSEWIKRFPQFENQLIEFTVAWIQTKHLPGKSDEELDPSRNIQTGMNIARQAYEKHAKEDKKYKGHSKPPLFSILAEGKKLGFSPEQLAHQVRLSVEMTRKLENRLLLSETIPPNLIDLIAQQLQRSDKEVLSYLNQPPMIPQSLRMKSRRAPQISQKQSFFDAIEEDTSLSDDLRNFWFSFAKKGK